MTDDQDEPKVAAETETGAIRGAFLARQEHAAAAPAGGSGTAEQGALAVRGVYLSRLTVVETRRGSGSTAKSEDSGDAALRSAYAARSMATPASAARAPARKAAKKAAPKKAAPKKAAAKKAPARKAPARKAPAKKTAKRAAKSAAKRQAAAPARSKRKAAPAPRAKKKARPAKRRR